MTDLRDQHPFITPAATGGTGTGGGGGSFSAGVSNIGNTSGDTGMVSNRLVLAGGNNVTVSQSTNAGGATVTISGGAGAGGFAGGGISGGNTAGDTGSVTGRLIFAGGNRITLSGSTNAGSETISIVGPNAQTAISGIVGSNATYTSGTVTFTGVGGGITVSSNTGQRIDLSVAAPVAQTVQTQNMVALSATNTLYSSGTVTITGSNMVTVKSSAAGQAIIIDATQTGTQFSGGLSNIGNTAGDTGTVAGRLVLAGGNRITLSGSTNGVSETVTISAPNAQTAISGIAASDTTYTSGSVTFTGVGGGVTVSSNTGQRVDISVAAPVAQTVQTQNVHNVTLSGNTAGAMAHISSGTMTLAGGNNITLSQAGNAVTISGAAAGGAQTAISGIANSETTYTSGSVTLQETGGGITIRSTTGQKFQFSVAAPVAQTGVQFSAGVSDLGNTSGDTGTVSNQLVISARGNLTAGQVTDGAGATVELSAGTQTVQTQNRFNLTLSGNTAGAMAHVSSGTLTLAGGAGIILSQTDTNKISIVNSWSTATTASSVTSANAVGADAGRFALEGHQHAGVGPAGVSNIGNTAGNTTVMHGRVVLAGGDNITLSVSSSNNNAQTITISAAAGGGAGFSAGASNLGNTAGSTGTVSNRLVIVGSGPISVSQSTGGASSATLSILGPATTSLSASTNITLSVDVSTIKFSVADPIRHQYYAPYQGRVAAAGQQGQATLHIAPMAFPNVQYNRAVFPLHYTQATNSTLTVTVSQWLGIYTKNASTLSMMHSSSTSQSINGSGTASSSMYSGNRLFTMGWTSTVTEGDYWVGIVSRTTTAGANATLSQLLASDINTAHSGMLGAASTVTAQYRPGLGHWSATTSGIPASIAFSHITGTASMALREPLFYLTSGTV